MPQKPPIKFSELAGFQPKQLTAWYALLRPETKYLLFGGSAYGGKSYFLRWAMIGLGMYYYAKYGFKNIPLGLFSEDYPSLKDRQVVRIKQEIPSFLGKLVDSRDEGYAFIAAPEYGSFIIYLRNLDDPSKYASVEFAAIGVEELTKNRVSTFDDLRFRLRYPGIDEVKFFAATNPGSIGHVWVKNKWVKPDPAFPDPEQSRFIFIPARYEDNKYITDDYVLQLDSLPENKRKAFKEGSWDVFAGQYFDEWSVKKHVITPFVPI
jgi:phage terminase large subunit